MTDPRGVHSAHLDAATIAAFVDRTLDPTARAAAEAHLADCADCREVWVETSELANEDAGAASVNIAEAPAARSRSRRWIYGGAGLAVAATLALVVFSPRMFDRGDRPELRELVEAVGTNRRTEARLTGGFEWGPVPQAMRSSDLGALSLTVRTEAEKLRETGERSASALAAAASASIVVGDYERARKLIDAAIAVEPDSADLWADLAAIELEGARLEDPALAAASLEASDRALSLEPQMLEALFNRALAFEYLGRHADADLNWRRYLEADGNSLWAAEVRARLERGGR